MQFTLFHAADIGLTVMVGLSNGLEQGIVRKILFFQNAAEALLFKGFCV